MKKVVIAIVVAVLIIITGAVMSVWAVASLGSDYFEGKGNQIQYLDEDFVFVEVSADMCDVWIFPSDENTRRIEYSLMENVELSVNVENGVLKINVSDNRKWYDHIGIFWPDYTHISVYLPSEEYKALSIQSLSGDVYVAEGACFEDVNIDITSGDVEFFGKAADELYIKTVSGDIVVSEITANNINLEATSGDIEVYSTIATERISISTTSGDMEFASIDAPKIELEAVSGDIEGTILTKKRINADTTSGDIDVESYNSADEICNASTVSGDIEIRIR